MEITRFGERLSRTVTFKVYYYYNPGVAAMKFINFLLWPSSPNDISMPACDS
jgi:hypothetical protein